MIDKQDRKSFVLIVVGLILLTTLPYYLAFRSQGNSWVFSGFFIGVDDGNSYLAKMLSGMYGSWLFKTPYTTQPQNGVIAFLPYLILGKLANPPAAHLQLILLFQLFRIFGIFIFTLGAYRFCRIYLTKSNFRMFGLILLTLGGGLGWLAAIFRQTTIFGTIPLDFYSPEAFGFLSLFALPHLATARGLMFFGISIHISLTQTSLSRSNFKYYLPGIFLFLSGLFQPLNTAIGGLILFLVSLSRFIINRNEKGALIKELTKLFQAVIPTLPIVLYYIGIQIADPFYKGWTAQNIITSPHPIHYLIAYAIPLGVILLSWKYLKNLQSEPKIFLLIVWILIFLLLPYIPYNLQRRLPDGIYFALIVLMLVVLEQNTLVRQKLTLSILSILLIPSSLMIIMNGLVVASNPFEPVFLSRTKSISYEQIGEVVKPFSRVLANFQTGNELPAWIPVYVAMGHGPESINLEKVKHDAEAFFTQNGSIEENVVILDSYQIEYVLYDKNIDFLPENDRKQPCYLDKILETTNHLLYRVGNCEN